MRWNMASAGLEIDLSCHVDKINHNEIKYLLGYTAFFQTGMAAGDGMISWTAGCRCPKYRNEEEPYERWIKCGVAFGG